MAVWKDRNKYDSKFGQSDPLKSVFLFNSKKSQNIVPEHITQTIGSKYNYKRNLQQEKDART